LQAYDEFCLERWESLRPKTREVVKDIVGFFFLEQSGSTDLTCAGFRISEQYVVTAAHCLWWRGAQIDPARLTFRLLSAPQLNFRPTALEYPRDIDDERLLSDRDDFAVLKIETHLIPLSLPINFFREQLPFTEYL
jgi:trypsin